MNIVKQGLELQKASVLHVGVKHKEELQKVFNHVVTHLFTQKVVCHKQTTRNKYTLCLINDEGHRCALGCLLPKDWTAVQSFYLEGLEFPIDTLHTAFQQVDRAYTFTAHKQHSFIDEIKLAGFNLSWLKDRFFLGRLQQVHDTMPYRDWYKALVEIAFNYGLDQSLLYKIAHEQVTYAPD